MITKNIEANRVTVDLGMGDTYVGAGKIDNKDFPGAAYISLGTLKKKMAVGQSVEDSDISDQPCIIIAALTLDGLAVLEKAVAMCRASLEGKL